jgi:hypothetical protein
MYIKLTKIYDETLYGKYAGKTIEGDKLPNGGNWKKSFFANQKELVQKLTDFSVGDEVNVVLQHVKDKIYNIVDIKELTDEDRAKIAGEGSKGGGSSANAAAPAGGFARRADGGSRGDDTNRSAALYFVKDLVMATKADAKLKKMTGAELLDEMLALSDIAYAYIKDGLFPAPADGMVPNRDAALDPPDEE